MNVFDDLPKRKNIGETENWNIKTKAEIFYEHILKHIECGDTGDKTHEPMCKICNKTITEIIGDL